MRQKTTIQDIANRSGVSKTTVSRFLNEKYDFMSDETRQRIAKVIEETGYRPSRVANSLKANRSGLVGFVMSNVMSNQTPRLLASVCDTCSRHGMKVIVVNSEKNPEKEKSLVYELLDQRVDGLLVVSGYNAEFYHDLDLNVLPVMLADRISPDIDLDAVAINHADSTRRVIMHLLKSGFEEIVIIARPHTNPNNTPALRVKSAENTCMESFGNDTHCRTSLIVTPTDDEDAVSQTEQVISILEAAYERSKTVPTAVFVAEATIMTSIACGYYRAGMKISDKFTIAGYTESDMTGMIVPPITTIEQPLERLGQLAMERLITRIESGDSNQDTVRETIYLSCKVTLAE